jgi:hypothetical protein
MDFVNIYGNYTLKENLYKYYCINKIKYIQGDFKIYYKYLPFILISIHFIIIWYLLIKFKQSILKECKNTINYYFTNKIKCFKFHIKPRRNNTRKTTNLYKIDNNDKIVNEINFTNFEEFYDYQYQNIKEFYYNFTDEEICNYALTLFDSKFALIKED